MQEIKTQTPAPVVIIPYVWIGDFVRCHSVVKLLREQSRERPVDLVSSTLCAPLADYMPGVRHAIVADLPRRRIGLAQQWQLATKLRGAHYAQALIMSRKWKAALAPFLAGIPRRTGFIGEARFGLINDLHFGERRLPRMIDRMCALALPTTGGLPKEWPLPELKVPREEIVRWRARRDLEQDGRPIVTLSPGAIGTGKAWPPGHYAALACTLAKDGAAIWVLGGPNEKGIAHEIIAAAGNRVHDLTGEDLRNAVIALAAADVSVTNDSGLMHVSAALGTLTIAIFGPTSPWHWKPLNPLAVILEPPGAAARERARRQGNDAVRHRRTADVAVETVLESVRDALSHTRQGS